MNLLPAVMTMKIQFQMKDLNIGTLSQLGNSLQGDQYPSLQNGRNMKRTTLLMLKKTLTVM